MNTVFGPATAMKHGVYEFCPCVCFV